MRNTNTLYALPITLMVLAAGPAVAAGGPKLDTAKIEQITGMKGTYNEKENTFKVTVPRNDVQVSVDGWKMPPFMGLGPWAAFTPHHSARWSWATWCCSRTR
jgi:hypothetical protein